MIKLLKNALLNVLLVAVSLAVGLVLIEVGVRVFGLYRFPSENFVESHPELGWSHIPGKEGHWTVGKQRIHVKINSKGLRDREYPYQKEKRVFRILVLGDSFTEAFQVPLQDTFCKVLEETLNRNKRERHFEVINAGFAGVGTDYQLLFLRREGYKYDPDLVISAFFVNDIYDNFKSKNIVEDKSTSVAYAQKGLATDLRQFLAINSCAYNYLGRAIPKHAPLLANFLMKLGVLSHQPTDEAEDVDQLHDLVFSANYGPQLTKAWEVTQILFSELANEAKKRVSRFAVISIPAREQVYENLWQYKLTQPRMRQRDWNLKKPDQLLSAFLDDSGIPFLELLPYFRKVAGESALYYMGADGHWNVKGHHLAGRIIHNWLIEENLVPISVEESELRAQS